MVDMSGASTQAGPDRFAHGNLLLVEDDPSFATVLARALQRRGFEVHAAASLDHAMHWLAEAARPPDFAVLDLNLGGSSGLRLIEPIQAANPRCRVLVLTGYASVATAVDAVKLGADQYLAKPAEIEAIVRALVSENRPDASLPPEDPLSIQAVEWEHIQRVLREHGGNISTTARALNMHRRTLQRKLLKRQTCVNAVSTVDENGLRSK
jgi:two-component system response regulator RegA